MIGKMKDEVRWNIICKFVGLKSKTNSLVMVYNEGIKKAKWANRTVVNGMRHKEYVDVLFSRGLVKYKTKRI